MTCFQNENMNKQLEKIPINHFCLVKEPSMSDFEYISEWLPDAYKNHKELPGYALYHNLNGFIYDAFKENTVFVLRYKDKAVAFLTFSPPSKNSIRIIFRLVCVNPNFLRMGLATYLHKSAIEHYQKQGCLVVELWNVCHESFELGKFMGFVKKEEGKNPNEVSMVKFLSDIRKQNRNAKIRFVVWGCCYADISTKPTYSWSLNFKRDKSPIIRSIDYEWTVGIIKCNEVIYHDIAKWFFGIFSGGNYIYIDEDKAQNILNSISLINI